MQPLPSSFLETIAKQYELSPEQTEALIKRLGEQQSEQDDAEALHISVNALRNRMSGVYGKFSIGGKGPGKLRRLHDFLSAQYRKELPDNSDVYGPETDIDALVQTVRQQVRADIHHRCGTMRVLDMEQPIGIGDIYTNVNILEKLSGRRRLGLNELLQDCDLENFDRFSLGQIRHERVPGLEAVERHRQLMVLGKPGAGKTTFMKRLATLCNQGEFQAGRVPMFVTLKEFAEAKGQPDLQTYIGQQWGACGVEDAEASAQILRAGGALILLDGLDEVQETDHDRILQDIKDFTRQYRDCQFVMTCRIAAREYTFQHFTEVEVADFDQEQIAEFATKWFTAKQDPEKGETLIQRLEDNEPIQELATNPLLLTLLCLVFGEANDFPANRAELYKEGLDVLLKKWDAKRNIERDQVYKKLSLKRKEDLLSQLAFATFEKGDYFFKQSVVEQHIIDYIRNLPGAQEDEEALQLDSEAVLKSIEAQHGLLVERARGIYSFSHLTFQEYFTAKQITRPTAQFPQALTNLAKHAIEKRYREIFLLTVSMLPKADELLISIKQQVDLLLAEYDDLQALMSWAAQKAESVGVSYKPAAVRAHYLSRVFDFSRVFALSRVLALSLDGAPSLALSLDGALSRTLSHASAHIFSLASLAFFRDLNCALPRAFNLDLNSTATIAAESNPTLKHQIDKLSAQLPSFRDSDTYAYWQWWKEHGVGWIGQLRQVMIKYRNIGHNWQFTDAQKVKLQQYYDANKLLVECLNSDCYVTKATRQYIEDTLLLPMSEIEQIPVPKN
ncbi:NACHT domain-containing NTPase [Halomicronema sp. CCY15110]|uniref:NACHT domain-containing protein n=1 Tax=Halomicronema sp. CCY15110 TaxID=2767773 RepID=UPI001EF175CC|nr:NACHT domain-containing NTPase [Halomicronema sp. CCY15110]